jgi:hypothetical protein
LGVVLDGNRQGGTAGTGKVNVVSTNPAESDECRNSKRHAGKKDGLVREQVAEQTHETCGTEAAHCRKALVSPEAFGQPIVSDQTKADRRNCRPKEPTGYSQEHFRDEHGRKARPKRQDQGRTGDRRDPKRDQWPLRPDHVEQFPAWYLD